MELWERSEQLTSRLYGKKTIASGSGSDKLDVKGKGIWSNWRVENKFTEKESYVLSLNTLLKMSRQALQMMSSAFLVLDFGGKHRYVILEEDDFINLVTKDNE